MNPATPTPLALWIGFGLFFLAMLGIDLGFAGRGQKRMSMKQSAAWTTLWISTALVFNAVVYIIKGREPALEFFAGYIIEYSLSVDNLFVFIMIFTFFRVTPEAQPRVLKWGILGALVMRGVFIALGAAILETFSWAIYVFGVFLVFTGVKMLLHREEDELHPDQNPLVRLARKFLPMARDYDGSKFTTRIDGRRLFTPLFVVLLVIESTDVVFAVDSIPAIFGITADPFIVYSSNVFAIMGLRALYFLLAGALGLFRYLKIGVAVVLVFVGCKMTMAHYVHLSIEISLGVVFLLLSGSIAASVVANIRDSKRKAS